MAGVVDGAEGGDGTRDHPEIFQQLFRLAKRDLARRADQRVHGLQIDARMLLHRQQEELVLLVLDEQVLGVTARESRRAAPPLRRR